MKGQTAIEYLMTYGWALLIVIVVIAGLWCIKIFEQPPYQNVYLQIYYQNNFSTNITDNTLRYTDLELVKSICDCSDCYGCGNYFQVIKK